ncbi:MAG: hypothetical protein ACAF41_33310 (plasmid) [Leptolyngbya sp. BL-A-14]
MAKGGARTGAGRKSKWSTSKTTNIRVPEHLAIEVMAYAQQLDRQRAAESQRQHLINLLEEYVKIPAQERDAWMQTLPEGLRQGLKGDQESIEISSRAVQSRMIYFEDPEHPDEEPPLEEEVKLEICNISEPEAMMLASNLGHRWSLLKQNGRLIVDLPSDPQEDIALHSEQGVVYLELRSRWEVSCLLPQNQSS